MKKLLVYGPSAMSIVTALAVGIPAAVAADSPDGASNETTATNEQKQRQEIFSKAA